jgi:hypothetical protein
MSFKVWSQKTLVGEPYTIHMDDFGGTRIYDLTEDEVVEKLREWMGRGKIK